MLSSRIVANPRIIPHGFIWVVLTHDDLRTVPRCFHACFYGWSLALFWHMVLGAMTRSEHFIPELKWIFDSFCQEVQRKEFLGQDLLHILNGTHLFLC